MVTKVSSCHIIIFIMALSDSIMPSTVLTIFHPNKAILRSYANNNPPHLDNIGVV